MGNAEILEVVQQYGVAVFVVIAIFLFLRNSEIDIRYPRNRKPEKTPDEVRR